MGPRRKITLPMFGDGIFTQDGIDWKRSRELLRPQFHFKHYSDLGIFRAATDNLINNVPTNEGILNRTALRGQIMNILIAERDTTACLLS